MTADAKGLSPNKFTPCAALAAQNCVLGDPLLATLVAIGKRRFTDPSIFGEPFMCRPANKTQCLAEKYRSGVKSRPISPYASGYGPLCLGATYDDDTHRALRLSGRCAPGTRHVRTDDEATVAISRHCQPDQDDATGGFARKVHASVTYPR